MFNGNIAWANWTEPNQPTKNTHTHFNFDIDVNLWSECAMPVTHNVSDATNNKFIVSCAHWNVA